MWLCEALWLLPEQWLWGRERCGPVCGRVHVLWVRLYEVVSGSMLVMGGAMGLCVRVCDCEVV